MMYLVSQPDALSMSGNPIVYRVSDSGTNRLALFAESRFGLADWRRVYEEERAENGPPDYSQFDFSEVLDGLLEYRMPDPAEGVHESETHCIRFFAAGRERFITEALMQSFNGAASQDAMPAALVPGQWYRIEVDYADGYNSESTQGTVLYDTSPPVSTLELFKGNEWVYGGKVVEVFQALGEYDVFQASTALDGKMVRIYEIPYTEKYALKGAWDMRDFPSRNAPLPAGRRYLSPKPLDRSQYLGQYDWIWVLPQFSPGTAELTLAANIFYTDAPDVPWELSLGTFEQYRPIAVNISDALREWSQVYPAGTIDHIEMEVQEAGYENMAQAVYLRMGYGCRPFLREFHFSNGMGGFDSLIAYGKGQAGGAIEASEARAHLSPFYSEPIGYARTVQRFRERFKASAGYRSLAEREAAKALLLAEKAYIREGDSLVPISILSSSWEDEKDGDRRHTLSFEYAYAFDNRSIRPQ